MKLIKFTSSLLMVAALVEEYKSAASQFKGKKTEEPAPEPTPEPEASVS